MTTLVGWTPPPGVAVVDPPVANWREVDLIFSDRSELAGVRAGSQNWSAVGGGPSIVAYAIVEEYKPAPEPREFWIVDRCEAYDNERDAIDAADALRYKCSIIHVREVLPAAREVVAWAVFRDGQRMLLTGNAVAAEQYAEKHGGTVVKLTGVMP